LINVLICDVAAPKSCLGYPDPASISLIDTYDFFFPFLIFFQLESHQCQCHELRYSNLFIHFHKSDRSPFFESGMPG